MGPSALRLRPPPLAAAGGSDMTGMPLTSTAIIGCCCGFVSAIAMPCTDSGSGHVPGYRPAQGFYAEYSGSRAGPCVRISIELRNAMKT